MLEKKIIKTFRDIITWQKAHQLVIDIYKVTEDFPTSEKFGLIGQLRRAVVSIACNIVEGFARKNIKESLNFYNIANASLEEVKYLLIVCFDIRLIKKQDYNGLAELAQEVGRILQGWIDSQKLKCLSC